MTGGWCVCKVSLFCIGFLSNKLTCSRLAGSTAKQFQIHSILHTHYRMIQLFSFKTFFCCSDKNEEFVMFMKIQDKNKKILEICYQLWTNQLINTGSKGVKLNRTRSVNIIRCLFARRMIHLCTVHFAVYL